MAGNSLTGQTALARPRPSTPKFAGLPRRHSGAAKAAADPITAEHRQLASCDIRYWRVWCLHRKWGEVSLQVPQRIGPLQPANALRIVESSFEQLEKVK